MRPQRTLRSLLVRKRPERAQVLGCVYRLDCSCCPWSYVGETGRPLSERMKEHRRSWKELDVQRSEVARHSAETGHTPDFQEAHVLEREPNWRSRIVKEALWTRRLDSSNAVKHDLGSSWFL